MKITFDTKNLEEVAEVQELLSLLTVTLPQSNGNTPTSEKEEVGNTNTAPEEEKPSEAPKTPKKTRAKKPAPASAITLGDLKAQAQEAVTRTDRQKVKETIGKYAAKLSDVSEEDYEKLFETLKAL